ncbi:hypothetical protein A1OO_09435 [Enterovibrio norvegicus FF-33]|uniref:Lipoprotein n=1 Tax=Enterovibrio norvegicus FF-454 TaxID=1185651 RepID=A0A1E5BY47_9GAMM|nr:DUF6279 family lipoprotein [Enterovibrio norvegicus]OEE58151.1 hypothetical protein A1OK_16440 [Enterovibrio norvegicus FF-454]OEE66015.1 hypothetical protein A1OO_09435 [Enterovibrio norvegicus FF-33]OEE75130.1 hypothetical protein A1OQ_23140 [Enterovibrio norvegicus FF-162]
MKRRHHPIRNLFFAALAAFSLAACTNQFAYNTLPFWIDYYLSDYVDMTSSQQKQLDQDLDAFHEWHRQTELPQIQALLNQLRRDTVKPLSYSQIGAYHQRANERVNASVEGLTPALVNLIRSLSDEQAAQWLSTMNDKIDEGVEEAKKGTLGEQRERRQDRLVERAEFWVDTVNKKQQLQLLEMATYQIEMRPVFYDIRDELVAEFANIITNRKAPDLAQRLNAYFTRLIHFQSDEYKNDMAIYIGRRYELLQRIDRNLTDKQRKALREKLTSLSDDIASVTKP